MKKPAMLTATALLCALVLSGCAGGTAAKEATRLHSPRVHEGGEAVPPPPGAGRAVAVVNGITLYESDVGPGTLEQAVREELLRQEAVRVGVADEIRPRVERYRAAMVKRFGADAAPRIERAVRGYEKRLLLRGLRDRLARAARVTEADVKSYYDSHRHSYESVAVKAIVFHRRGDARRALTALKRGRERFDTLFDRYLSNPSHDHRAEFRVDPPYRDRISTVETGGLSTVIYDGGEYKIVKVVKRTVQPLSEVRDEIVRILKTRAASRRMDELADRLRKSARIRYLDTGATGANIEAEFLARGSDCKSLPRSLERMRCMRPHLIELAERRSPRVVLQLGERLEREGVISDCHMVAHFMGEYVGERYGYDLGKAYQACSRHCNEGCFHSATAVVVGAAGWSAADAPRLAVDLCRRNTQDALLYRQSMHGVGHGLVKGGMRLTEAAAVCRRLPSFREEEACLGGVFMENTHRFMNLPPHELRAAVG